MYTRHATHERFAPVDDMKESHHVLTGNHDRSAAMLLALGCLAQTALPSISNARSQVRRGRRQALKQKILIGRSPYRRSTWYIPDSLS